MKTQLQRKISIPERSNLSEEDYTQFLQASYKLLEQCDQYLTPDEDINCLELAHLIPDVEETVIAIYVGINDAVCNKGLVSPFLIRHGHNNVFVFDSDIYSGDNDVPNGTIDAKKVLNGFEPPNSSWNSNWTYVMIADPKRTFKSLWQEKGYIDMIPAKFEDFSALTDINESKTCTFIDPKAFEHPVNAERDYLKAARDRGQKMVGEFHIPIALEGETKDLTPVVLNKGEKLYVARDDFGPCAHCWSNIHPDNKKMAVVNENSAVPLDLVIAKPSVDPKYAQDLIPAKGSADMTTDWFYRGQKVVREALLQGLFKG